MATFVTVSLLLSPVIPAVFAESLIKPPIIIAQPDVESDVAPYVNDWATEPKLPKEMLVKLLRDRIKYVFVIFNENHSFDNEYGTFPGVNGLYSDGQAPRDADAHAGLHPDLHGCQRPDRSRSSRSASGPRRTLPSSDSVDHSHIRSRNQNSTSLTAWRRWTGSPPTSTTASPTKGGAGQRRRWARSSPAW